MDGGFRVDGEGFGAETGGGKGAAGESVVNGNEAEAHVVTDGGDMDVGFRIWGLLL